MRSAIIAALVLSGITCWAGAREPDVDLDKPGAMEILQRDRPEHHKRILDAISEAQTIHVDTAPIPQHAVIRTDDPRWKGASHVLPSNPAKKRLVVPIDDVVYRVTAHDKRPGET